jgi:hypothetical protein
VETGTVTGNSANAQQVAANDAKKVGLYKYLLLTASNSIDQATFYSYRFLQKE